MVLGRTSLYPLHPLSAIILPYLCQLISQNERTLFNYLGSSEQDGFKDMLKRIEPGQFILPAHIFDYFLVNQATIGGDYLTQRRWAEAAAVIERVHKLNTQEQELLKTIGLVNLLGNRRGVQASALALESVYGSQTKKLLRALSKCSAIVHRKFNNEYRVWQGSDFDFEASIAKQKRQLAPFSIAEEIMHNIPLAPIVARKYSIEKGALRYFVLHFVDAGNFKEVVENINPQIFIFIAEREDDRNVFYKEALSHLSKKGLVAYWVPPTQLLRNLMCECIAMQQIEQQTRELNEDPVAKKEFGTRLASIRYEEQRAISQIITSPQRSKWFLYGEEEKVESRRSFQQLLDKELNRLYPSSPQIYNELINRANPSPQAVSAAKRLMLAMMSKSNEKDLGIDKFPPEKAIYRAVLKDIHRCGEDKKSLCFGAPSQESSLYPVWERIEDFLAETEGSAQPFTAINAELLAPPYGVKAGVLPILWLAAYLANEHEVAIYEGGRYAPLLTEEMLERFIKRPDKFSVQRFRIEGLRAAIFKQYCDVVSEGVKPKTVLDVAKPLARFIGGLPEYTLTTRRDLSAKTLAVRDSFIHAKTPEALLFDALPKALGYDEERSKEGEFSDSLKEVLRELKDAHPQLVADIKRHFARSLGLATNLGLGRLRDVSRRQCSGLENYSMDDETNNILHRINRRVSEPNQWFDAILLYIGGKPSKAWSDKDKDKAKYRLTQFSCWLRDLIKIAETDKNIGRKTPATKSSVYLLKSIKQGDSPIDEVVRVEEKNKKKIEAIKEIIHSALEGDKDEEIRLAALAQVVNEFLRNYKENDTNARKPSTGYHLENIDDDTKKTIQ